MCTNAYSFEYLLNVFIAERVPSEATIKHHKFVSNLFQKENNIDDIREIERKDVIKWRNEVLIRASAQTCNNYIRHLKSLFNCAVENEILEKNPFAKVPIITVHQKPNKSTNRDIVAKAINLLKDKSQDSKPGWFWIAVIRTYFYTGMRRRQLVELQWKDIHFEDRLITLRAESSKTKREWDIPLNKEILKDLIRLRKEAWDIYGVDSNIEDIQVFNVTLFNSRYRRKEMTVDQLSGFFRWLSNNIGFKLTPHRFRHRLATELVNKKDDIKVVKELLGHTNILTTYKYVSTDLSKMRSLVSEITPL